jgi:hypothetical protein
MEAQNKSAKRIAKGTFDVKVTPLAAEDNIGDPTIGRLSLDKTWSGDLSGTSKGQMLGSQSETEKGSGGYVAMERFTGTLNGKSIMEQWAAENLKSMFMLCQELEAASLLGFQERSRSLSKAENTSTNSNIRYPQNNLFG